MYLINIAAKNDKQYSFCHSVGHFKQFNVIVLQYSAIRDGFSHCFQKIGFVLFLEVIVSFGHSVIAELERSSRKVHSLILKTILVEWGIFNIKSFSTDFMKQYPKFSMIILLL